MGKSDYLVIVFPLYVYCLPALLIEFLNDYYLYINSKAKTNKEVKVYAIVNCGFPEPNINEEALQAIENFCRRLGYKWKFGIGISMGEFIYATRSIPVINKLSSRVYSAINAVYKDVQTETDRETKNIFVKPSIPNKLFFISGSLSWISLAKKNKLKKKDLYRTPYESL